MRVLVVGIAGKMGQEVAKMVQESVGLELAGGVDLGKREIAGVKIFTDLNEAIDATQPNAVVDFTTPDSVESNMEICYAKQVPMVIGTTGLSTEALEHWKVLAKKTSWKAIIAPNFAIGAVLMMEFAKEAARYSSDVEIIEYHHNQKKDAPSGTALKTARQLEAILGRDIPVHSVRLPGYVAHQEVIFGFAGQTLTIRHDSIHRESFMPGVKLALEQVLNVDGLIFGLEHILPNSTHLQLSHIR